MRFRGTRRLLSAALSAVLVVLAPGLPAYQAAAQTFNTGVVVGEVGAVRVVPNISPSVTSLPINASLTSPVLGASLPGNILSLPSAAVNPVESRASIAVPVFAVNAKAVKSVSLPSAVAVTPAESRTPDASVAVVASRRFFDGNSSASSETPDPVVPTAAEPISRWRSGLRKAVLAVSLSLLTFSPLPAQTHGPAIENKRDSLTVAGSVDSLALRAQAANRQAQHLPAPASPSAAAVQAAPVAADTVEERLPRPLAIMAATIERQGVTVGDRIHLTLTVKNPSRQSITVVGLRAAVNDALPEDLEVQQPGADAPLTLAPGETKTVVYALIPFASGEIAIDEALIYAAVNETALFPDGIEIAIPKTVVTVKTVLTPDWKEKGPRDIVDTLRKNEPHWAWLAAIPLAILLFAGVERLVSARRFYPKLDARRLSLVAATEAAIARLENGADSLDEAAFHARTQDIVSGFMTDFAGLPRATRDAKSLAKALKAAKTYDAAQVDLAADIALRAERARFSGGADAAERGRQIGRLKLLISAVAGRAAEAVSKGKKSSLPALLGFLPAAAGLQFGNPWVLLLLIPYAAFLAWTLRGKTKKAPAFTVSSSDQVPAKRTWRARLAGLPRSLRLAAVGLLIVALAGPMIGITRQKTVAPSTDTVVSIDLSGSMDEKMGGGSTVSKLHAAEDAVRTYVEEQRRGTQNRVGMVTFSDNAYLDVKLTTDYDALIAHLQDLKTSGSTAIGKSMLAAIGHFAELNALELDATDPRVAEVQRLLKRDGLPAALAYAKAYPDLMEQILRPDRAKIVVVFTDGQSNEGIHPLEAANIAAQLGVRVYAVGVGDGSGLDEATLIEVAARTGAKYFRAGDVQSAREVMQEISRLEKSPVTIASTVAVKDYTAFLAMLAFFLLGAEVLLANTRLRTLYGMAFIMALPTAGVNSYDATFGQKTTMTISAEAPAATRVPPAMAEGNALYAQGRYDEALKKYAEALESNPDLAELYFNMGDAYMRLGDPVRAEASYRKFLTLTADPKLQSLAFYNIGNAALMKQDGEGALENYKEALRRDGSNQDAKWNLEILKKAQQEQQNQDQQDSKKKQKGKKGQKGQKGQPQPGEKGEPGDQEGQPGDQQGKPGDQKSPGKPDPKKGADQLGDKLGEQEGKERDAQRKGMTRKGSGVWGALALALPGIAFSSTGFLWTVGIGLPLIAALIAWGMYKRMQAARALSPGAAPKSFKGWWGRGRFLRKAAMVLAAVGLLGLASTDPKGGQTEQKLDFGGKDVMVTVDGSYSMIYAEDGRLLRTKKELTDFIERLRGADRVGLVIFAGEPRVASPISIDYGNFEFKVGRLEHETRGLKEGSNLAEAVKYSAERFETVKKIGDRQRIMIVVSDGDVDAAEIDAAIKAAREHGITIYAIGVGDPSGTRIKIPTEDGKGTEYLIDEKTDRPAVTKLVEEPLRRLSESTGGAYFRSGAGMGIDQVLTRVAELQKGSEGDVIKSPKSIAAYFLWPALALLLLDLLLPGRSLLRRDAPKSGNKTAGVRKKGAGGPGMMAGISLLPLGAWPVLLPFAILGLAVAAFVAADVWSDGAITRRLRETWQRRGRVIEKGVRADLALLFDLREADEPRLAAFVTRWQAAKDDARAALLAEASRDEALGREMLAAACLSGSDVETQEKALAALAAASRARFESLQPMAKRLTALRGKLGWLSHSDAAARLTALEDLARGTAAVVEAPAPSPIKRGLGARVKRYATAGALVLTFAATLISTDGYLRYRDASAQAAETATRIFYAEDAFVFNDAYRDERIPNEVLPVLRLWHENPEKAGPEFQRALEILRSSPDPKADNLLVAVFRHAGLLPLNGQAETTLLRSLIERDSESLWASMDALIAASAENPRATQMLAKLVVLAVEEGGDRAIFNAFHVLKSPNDQLRGHAFQALYKTFAANDATFFARLGGVQEKHAADPNLQIWVGVFAAQRFATPGVGALDLEAARAVLDRVLEAGSKVDAARVGAFAKAKLGAEVEAPAPFASILLSVYSDALENSKDSTGKAPPALVSATRYLLDRAMTAHIQEAEKVLAGLHERLIRDGVVPPDQTSPEQYDDDHGHGYYRPATTSSSYRETYDLPHLRAYALAVAELSAAATADTTKRAPAVLEIADREKNFIEVALKVAPAAGMTEGSAAADLVAAELRPMIEKTISTFSNKGFLSLLRAQGLAPAIGDPASATSLPRSFNASGLLALRGIYLDLAKSGQGWDYQGKSRPLTWNEQLQIVAGLRATDEALAKHFPASAPAATSVLEDFERAGEESIALARLSAAADSNAADAAFLLRLETALLERLSGPRAAGLDSTQTVVVLSALFDKLRSLGKENEAFKKAEAALGAVPSPALVAALKAQVASTTRRLAEAGETAFGSAFQDEMIDSDLRLTNTSWRPTLDRRQLQSLLKAYALFEARTKAPTPAQKAAVRAAEKTVPALLSLAVRLGVPAGDAAADGHARVTGILERGYRLFAGSTFLEAARHEGFALKNGETSRDKAYRPSYSREEVVRLRAWLKKTLAEGKGWGYSYFGGADKTRPELSEKEKEYLRGAIAELDRALSSKKSAHGAALLGLGLMAGLGPWVLFTALAFGALYLLHRFVLGKAARASREPRDSLSDGVAARRDRIGIAAGRFAQSPAGGAFRSLFVGPGGTDFAEARPYQGEDYREVDWKTSAKKGDLYAKKFELEREMPLLLLVDVSKSGAFGTRGTDKRSVIEDIAGVLALAAAKGNVRVGAILFSDRVEAVIPPRGGQKHAASIIDAILNAEAAGKGTDMRPALDAAQRLSSSRAMVIAISDFLSPSFADELSALSKRHDLRAIRVADPAETKPLPDSGLVAVVDAETGVETMVDTSDPKYRSETAAAVARREARIAEALTAARVRAVTISTEGDPIESLAAHFHPKAKPSAKP